MFSAKHVGYGPSGTPAGIVVDKSGKQIGKLTTLTQAQNEAAALNALNKDDTRA